MSLEQPSPPPVESLPPVEPPSAGFIIQLFVIPAAIVAALGLAWGLFTWLAHAGADPQAYVEALKRDNESRWQAAHNLADVLRNPGHESVKKDAKLLGELTALLEQQIEAGSMSEKPVEFRMYLCRAIGEFHLPAALPSLVRAAKTERDPKERDVRLGALQAIARLVPQIADAKPRANVELREALLAASRDADSVVRYHAAYTLGVLGGDEALARLKALLDDAAVDVRMNAATGLARYGAVECVPELARMLDPSETAGILSEQEEASREIKRRTIYANALEAARQFAAAAPQADVAPLVAGLDKLLASKPDAELRLAAEDARRTLTAKR